jgi:nucleotide-binding universal stress UspA family protein
LIATGEYSQVTAATIAWDGGKSSGEAIHFLAMRPLLRGLRATLLYVQDGQRIPPALHDAQAHLQGAGLDVKIDLHTGAVTEAILAGSERHGSELLVIGAYGHSRIRHLVVGSTTTEILMRATTSVLVFH